MFSSSSFYSFFSILLILFIHLHFQQMTFGKNGIPTDVGVSVDGTAVGEMTGNDVEQSITNAAKSFFAMVGHKVDAHVEEQSQATGEPKTGDGVKKLWKMKEAVLKAKEACDQEKENDKAVNEEGR